MGYIEPLQHHEGEGRAGGDTLAVEPTRDAGYDSLRRELAEYANENHLTFVREELEQRVKLAYTAAASRWPMPVTTRGRSRRGLATELAPS